jgi:uncharacterized protein YkwD
LSLRALALLAALACGTALAAPAAGCELSGKERALAQLLVAKPAQLRPRLDCDPALVEMARARARDMATRGYFHHRDPDGVGPNDFLRRHGFALPSSYPSGSANTVEAIVGGYSDPDEVWSELLGSALHRAHMLGEEPTFLEQDRFGIGYVREWNTPQVDFWVVLIARHAAADEPPTVCSPPPTECMTAPRLKQLPEQKRRTP